jgi:hypothetical protein
LDLRTFCARITPETTLIQHFLIIC